ncbi:hypothetical protein AX15_004182 [Amanita polypyramis BW_CC]|nr:hypothetical protein AX15_004182 [Amanita polypyramis BW_CC]
MLAQARPLFSSSPWLDKVAFAQGNAEDLQSIGVQDSSVDLMISAQAAHWFDWAKVWPETRRVLRKGGCAAFWIYSEFYLPFYPSTKAVITRYANARDPVTSLWPHFERPGRTILENHLLDVPPPSTMISPCPSSTPSILDPAGCGLGDFERVFFAGPTPPPSLNLPPTTRVPRLGRALANTDRPPSGSPLARVEHNPIILTKSITWLELLAYLRSWSALHNYFKKYPEDRACEADKRFLEEDLRCLEEEAKGSGKKKELVEAAVEQLEVDKGDIAIRFWKDLREAVSQTGGKSGVLDMITISWPVAMLLARRT